MKLRVIATLVAVLAFGVGSASAQSIGVFADPGSSSCNIAGTSVISFYVNVVGSGSLSPAGITGAEFRLDVPWGPADAAGVFETPNPAASVNVGASILVGKNIAFPACQVGPSIGLYTVTVLVANPAAFNDITVGILPHTTPSNVNFQCPVVNQCDAPAFTAVCVPGGEAFINSQRDCTVAVQEKTWSEVKNLFN
jgi:hypothetical protein